MCGSAPPRSSRGGRWPSDPGSLLLAILPCTANALIRPDSALPTRPPFAHLPRGVRPPLRRLALGLALVGLLPTTARAGSHFAPPVAEAEVAVSEKHIRRLELWARSSHPVRSRIDPTKAAETVTLAMTGRFSDRRGRELDLALLDLLGSSRGPDALPQEDRLSEFWLAGLHQRLAEPGANPTLALLTDEVLGLEPDKEFELEHFLGTAEALAGRHHPRSLQGLTRLSLAPGQPESVRAAAGRALAGWPIEAASTALLEAVLADPSGLPERTLLLLHLRELEKISAPPGDSVGWTLSHRESLGRAGLNDLVAEDWRLASRAVELARYSAPESVLPRLVEALATWQRRLESAEEAMDLVGVLRLQKEIGRTLCDLSGASIGPHADRWRQFLSSRRRYGAPLEPTGSSPSGTVASFFGLPIDSGSIAFVLDQSGSMKAPAPPGSGRADSTDLDKSRFESAARQLLESLTATSSKTRFHIVLFSGQARVWRDESTQADKRGLEAARDWLERQNPNGGTHLAMGFEALLDLGSGLDDQGRLAFDTVIVLCDGQTVEGASWARSWLDRFGHPAGLKIHAIQIGGAKAQALRTLTQETGGTMIEL